MDNFDDFLTSGKSTSSLASIFGRSSTADNSSLIYTPKKQPKKPQAAEPAVKLELITFKSVHAFQLSSGAYQPLGKMGLALVGCQSPPVFQLLLYRTKESVTCKIRIQADTVFSILDNNYASFYSEDNVNYSVMFENSSDVELFAQQIAVTKSAISSQMVVQDVSFSNGQTVPEDSLLQVRVTPYQLFNGKISPIASPEVNAVQLSNDGNNVWTLGLHGMKYGSKRVVILPLDSSDPWKKFIAADGKLLIHVGILEPMSKLEKPSIPGSSSGDESVSFREKGVLIEDVISGKSQKSGLLSRVARLGQATLPLKGAVAAELTDSDEDSSPSPKPRVRSKPPAALLKNALKPVETVAPVALYQPQYQTQILNPYLATTPTSLVSPVETGLSAHFSESRTQAAELRMCLSKVADKVDVVINKLQTVNAGLPTIPVACSDSAGVLSGVQALVLENQAFKDKIEEQKLKIDAQSERIYHLLEISHKSLEQNATALRQPDEQVNKKEIDELKDAVEKAKNDAVSVTAELEITKNSLKEFQCKNAELIEKISETCSEKNNIEEVNRKLEKEMMEIRVGNSKLENEKLKDLEAKCNALTKELDSMKHSVGESEKLELKLTEENDELKKKIQNNDGFKMRGNEPDTKALMNMVYKKLYTEFDADGQYSGTDIKHVLGTVIKELTLEFLEQTETPVPDDRVGDSPGFSETPLTASVSEQTTPSIPSPVAYASHTGAQSYEDPETLSQPNKLEDAYNQVWLTSEPPPLPAFDEDDNDNAW